MIKTDSCSWLFENDLQIYVQKARILRTEMNTYKITKKKNIRPKSDAAFLDISYPFAFKHEIHVGQTDFEERLVDTPPSSPPAPCPGSQGSQNSSGDTSVSAV